MDRRTDVTVLFGVLQARACQCVERRGRMMTSAAAVNPQTVGLGLRRMTSAPLSQSPRIGLKKTGKGWARKNPRLKRTGAKGCRQRKEGSVASAIVRVGLTGRNAWD